MGYKLDNNQELIRQEIISEPRIQAKILEYLIEKERLEREVPGRTFFYTDETPVYTNYVQRKALRLNGNSVEQAPKTGQSIGKGKRFSVIHTGSINGFVEGAALITEDNITAEIYEEYIDKVCQLLPPNSVVIYDNASYHTRHYNKRPTMSSRKVTMTEWLDNNKINYQDYEKTINRSIPKRELMVFIKQSGIKTQYYVDNIVRKWGHTSLRLPPYCCDANPIEYIWNDWKNKVKSSNFLKLSNEDFIKLCHAKFNEIDEQVWATKYRHVVLNWESEYWKKFDVSKVGYVNDHSYGQSTAQLYLN